MKFTNFIPLQKEPRLKEPCSCKKSVNPLSSYMKNLRNTKLTGYKRKKNSRIKRFGIPKRKIYQSQTLDRQKQYSRKNCLFVHGVDKKNNKNTEQATVNIKNDLTEEITIHDIDKINHLGKHKLDNIPQLIIVELARYNVCNRIFKIKKKLKEKNVRITESLIKKE